MEFGTLSNISERADQSMITFRTRLRARYAETDAAGIVYYNAYFLYFEVGRVELFRELGLPYNWRLPIVETHCRYHASAVFDDLIEVESVVEELRVRAFRIGQRVYRLHPGREAPGNTSTREATTSAPHTGEAPLAEERELLATGYTVMMTQDESGPVPLPAGFRKAFEKAQRDAPTPSEETKRP